MEIVKTVIGSHEIASPMFHGPITPDAAEELAERLVALAKACRELNEGGGITTENIGQALADERHLGFGYACARDIPSESKRSRLDNAVAGVARELGLDAEMFFHWTNSKYGRWLADGILGRNESPTRETVRKYLNREAIERLSTCEGQGRLYD